MFGLVPFKRNNNLNSIGDEFENLMTNFFNDDFFTPLNTSATFKTDIKDKGNEYEISVDLPGVDRKDISVEYNNNNLIISAKREENKENKEEKDEKCIRKECSYGEMKRTFYIDKIKEDKISAKFDNGVLKLVIPKEENASTKKITIQ